MKVIFLKDVKNVGFADNVLEVSDGYARNYLFPHKLAVAATIPALQALEQRKKTAEAQKEKERSALRELSRTIDSKDITIAADAGEGGKLFGSVTASDIAQKVRELFHVDLDKKKIHLDEPIKSTGVFQVNIRFAPDISAKINVNVTTAAR